MLKNILFLLFGAIITILLFGGLFAGLIKPERPNLQEQQIQEN